VTDPEANEADRQEQHQLATPPVPDQAGEISSLPDDVPEGDGVEQRLSAVPGSTGGPRGGIVEADEYDVLEQQAEVPADEDDVRD